VSDPRHEFETWLRDALRRPVPVDATARARIMSLVRAEARARRPEADRSALSPAGLGARRGRVAGPAGALLAAGVAGLVALGALDGRIGLSSLRGVGSAGARPVAEAAIRDTLRLVRFVLTAPAARSVALVGDFNGWSRRATPLVVERGGAWVAAVALAPGRHRYAYVVDDTQWVTDPVAPAAQPDSGPPASVLFVADAR
jgi:hypothetical protein